MRVENIEKAPSAIRSLVEYIDEVERIQDGTLLPRRWRWYRRWLALMPMAMLKGRVNRVEAYYVERFGYVRKKDTDGYGDVYEVDQRCVGAICTVVILAWGGLGIHEISRATGLAENRVGIILKNYKYYVGWHNAYTEDGRRIWPVIREVALIHKDMTGEEVLEAKQDVIECEELDK